MSTPEPKLNKINDDEVKNKSSLELRLPRPLLKRTKKGGFIRQPTWQKP